MALRPRDIARRHRWYRPPFPERFGVIYADPPWDYGVGPCVTNWGQPYQHYKCMSTAEIAAMPIADLAAKDAILFIWSTDDPSPGLPGGDEGVWLQIRFKCGLG